MQLTFYAMEFIHQFLIVNVNVMVKIIKIPHIFGYCQLSFNLKC